MSFLNNFFKRDRKVQPAEKKSCGSYDGFDPYHGLTDVQRMLAIQQNGGVDWINSNDPYIKVLILKICQTRNAEKLGEVITYAYLRSRTGEKKKIERDPIFDVIFGMPNDLERDPQSLFQFMLLQYYQTGVAYAHAIGRTDRSVMSIEPHFSGNVTPVEGDNVFEPRILGFDVTGKAERIPPEDMLAVRCTNPFHRIVPLSPYTSLYAEMEMMALINQWQRNNFTRGVKVDGIVNLHQDFGTPDDAQWEDIHRGISRRYEGPDGQRILVMAGGGKAIAVKTSPADMDMIQSERFSAAMIASAYGMPLELLSLDTVNYATAWVPAERSWIKNTIVPLAWHFVRALNSTFYRKADREIVLGVDQIPELMPTLEELENSHILTVNEKRAMRGLPVLDDEMAGRLLVPVSLQPLEALEKEEKPEEENI